MMNQIGLLALTLAIATLGRTIRAGDPVQLQAGAKTITGTVTDVNSAPAAGAEVALYSLKPKAVGPVPRKDGDSPTGDPPAGDHPTGDPPAGSSTIGAPNAIPLQKPGDTLVTKTKTDAAGKFTFNAVAPGPYLVVAGTGRNVAKVNVDVKPDATPAPLSLKLPSK